jgi:hypothetical protein
VQLKNPWESAQEGRKGGREEGRKGPNNSVIVRITIFLRKENHF